MKKKLILRTISLIVLLLCFAGGFLAGDFRFNFLRSRHGGAMHISIDDTILVFEDITKNEAQYDTVFDNYTLGYLKRLHDEYGAIFSMYCWYENDDFDLSMCTNKFRKEFEDNSDWLKFNYHSFNSSQNPGAVDYMVFIEQYDMFRTSMEEIVGDKSWDNYTRLHFFAGSQEMLEHMGKYGTIGFYSADDDRVSYQLSNNAVRFLAENRIYYDDISGIEYKRTDIRLDYFDNPFYELYRFDWTDIGAEIFTHEWLISSPKGNSIWKLEEVCKYSKYYGISFIY